MRLVTTRDLVHYQDARAALYAAFATWFEGRIASAELRVDHHAGELLPPAPAVDRVASQIVPLVAPGSAELLRVLAHLCADGARALRRGDLSSAAALLAAQRELLGPPAAQTLRPSAAQLQASGDAAIRALGAGLAALLDEDAPVSAARHPVTAT